MNNEKPDIIYKFELNSKKRLKILDKPIPIEFKIKLNQDSLDNETPIYSVNLNYYPILLYFSGKNLFKDLNDYLKFYTNKMKLIKTFDKSGFLLDEHLEKMMNEINEPIIETI